MGMVEAEAVSDGREQEPPVPREVGLNVDVGEEVDVVMVKKREGSHANDGDHKSEEEDESDEMDDEAFSHIAESPELYRSYMEISGTLLQVSEYEPRIGVVRSRWTALELALWASQMKMSMFLKTFFWKPSSSEEPAVEKVYGARRNFLMSMVKRHYEVEYTVDTPFLWFNFP
ncbi:hypothetical protein GCK32_021427 [Trichostrongylus colubriformis]|uniref:Uncharacterized protein n=1 Tax=Trichostrongylus colubriformis TaxID=6319 RepID=A0AAN8F8X8_TRICO